MQIHERPLVGNMTSKIQIIIKFLQKLYWLSKGSFERVKFELWISMKKTLMRQ